MFVKGKLGFRHLFTDLGDLLNAMEESTTVTKDQVAKLRKNYGLGSSS
jgi:hypothetical protein